MATSEPYESYEYDVIVIGAGHNGLTCACYLARAGLKALCLDKLAPGGRLVVTVVENPVIATSGITPRSLRPRPRTDTVPAAASRSPSTISTLSICLAMAC